MRTDCPPRSYVPSLLPFISTACGTLYAFRHSIPPGKTWRDAFGAAGSKVQSELEAGWQEAGLGARRDASEVQGACPAGGRVRSWKGCTRLERWLCSAGTKIQSEL